MCVSYPRNYSFLLCRLESKKCFNLKHSAAAPILIICTLANERFLYEKGTFIGLSVSALALSLVAGAAIRSSIGKALLSANAAWSGSGTRTESDPYQIATLADLEKFRDICNGTNGEKSNASASAVLTADFTGENKITGP